MERWRESPLAQEMSRQYFCSPFSTGQLLDDMLTVSTALQCVCLCEFKGNGALEGKSFGTGNEQAILLCIPFSMVKATVWMICSQ